MIWIRRELANERFMSQRDWQVDVESSEMREELGLRYYSWTPETRSWPQRSWGGALTIVWLSALIPTSSPTRDGSSVGKGKRTSALYPDDTGLARWAGAVQQLYVRAKACVATDGRLASRRQLALEKQLLTLCRPFSNDQAAPQAKLCRRIERFIKELFVFVSHPDVPSENNAAEWSLRHLVISRKISGGTRSEQGTNSRMTLASLCGAWRAKGLNPLSECQDLLASPQL